MSEQEKRRTQQGGITVDDGEIIVSLPAKTAVLDPDDAQEWAAALSQAVLEARDPPEQYEAVCPMCRETPYAGSHNGTNCYKCKSTLSSCSWAKSPLARTKAELRRVNAHLQERDSDE